MTDNDAVAATRYVIIGAGPAGRATAKQLVRLGHTVELASRSGTGPDLAGVRRLKVDATDSTALCELATGAKAIFNCLNPTSYTVWDTEWPPMHRALMAAAQASGAVLVTLSNLYMYGPLRNASAITPTTPEEPQDSKGRLRAAMDDELLAAHRAGDLRAAVVRASDFIGPHIGAHGHATRNIPAIAQGRRAWVLGSADQPHSWTAINDVGSTLAAVAVRPETHGHVWFVPTNPPTTQRELASASARALHLPAPKVSGMPRSMLRALGFVSPMIRELNAVSYQFEGPWVIDTATTEETLGITPTDWSSVVGAAAHGNIANSDTP